MLYHTMQCPFSKWADKNGTICTTGHTVDPSYREMGAHYSLTIHIGRNVWIGRLNFWSDKRKLYEIIVI